MKFKIKTKGFNDIIDISGQVNQAVKKSGIKNGVALIFVAHSTAAVSTIEYEQGALQDLKDALERVAPMNEDYEHCKKWGDCNGYAHIRACLMKPSLVIPVENGKLVLGQWQQPILVDFDNRPRTRKVTVKVVE